MVILPSSFWLMKIWKTIKHSMIGFTGLGFPETAQQFKDVTTDPRWCKR